MSDLDDVIRIVLTRESTPVTTTSFSIPLILAEHTVFTERTRTYTSEKAVAEDFVSTSAVYKIAEKLFSQSTVGAVPSKIIVGRKAAAETWTAACDALELEDDSWYALIIATQVLANQESVSDWVNARRKILAISTADTNAPTTATTDIGYILKAKSAGRTFGVYLPTAAADYPEAAWVGSQLGYTPGNNDWDFKRAVGVTVSKLSDTAKTNLRNKNLNFYTSKHGVAVFQDGNMFDGTPIDQVIGEDWLYASLQEAVYFRIINTLKIPMDNVGLAMVESEIRSVLARAEANKLIDAGWTVTTPDVMSIPENLRAQRTAGSFVFRCRLRGSIRKVDAIQGFLSV